MSSSYFFRDVADINQLLDLTTQSKKAGKKPVEYKIIKILALEQSQFNGFIQNLRKDRAFLIDLQNTSYIDQNFVWYCIQIMGEEKGNILVYTAGYIYPRFTGLC